MYDPDKECKEMIETVKRLCEQKNITPHVLAKQAGISTSTISYLVNGKTKPQVYTVLLLCNGWEYGSATCLILLRPQRFLNHEYST